jgi:hypothetical protein
MSSAGVVITSYHGMRFVVFGHFQIDPSLHVSFCYVVSVINVVLLIYLGVMYIYIPVYSIYICFVEGATGHDLHLTSPTESPRIVVLLYIRLGRAMAAIVSVSV